MSDEFGRSIMMFGLGTVVGLAIGMVIAVVVVSIPKDRCEKTLPRNVECVWAPPEAMKDE